MFVTPKLVTVKLIEICLTSCLAAEEIIILHAVSAVRAGCWYFNMDLDHNECRKYSTFTFMELYEHYFITLNDKQGIIYAKH